MNILVQNLNTYVLYTMLNKEANFTSGDMIYLKYIRYLSVYETIFSVFPRIERSHFH